MKPFVKWVGGKRSIVDDINKMIPKKYKNYYEPFVGGGSLLFYHMPKNATISDINYKLITTYNVVKNNPLGLISELKKHQDNYNLSLDYYLAQRDIFNTTTNEVELAACFIFLNKTCFNGLYRENKNGKFNVPMGKYKNPLILDKENITSVSTFLNKNNITILHQGFENTKIEKGSFYYFDPPYHETYSQYNKNKFNEGLQVKLFNLCKEINNKGGFFIQSNSNTDFINKTYNSFNIKQIMASRSISRKGNQRKKEKEVVITNF